MSKSTRDMGKLVLLLLLAYIFAMFQGGFVSWFLFFTLLPMVSGSLLWRLLWFQRLVVERNVTSEQAVVGEFLVIKIKIKNPRRLPYVYLQIEDQLALRNQSKQESFSTTIFPWFKKELELEYQLDSLPRGVLRFEQLVVQTGDLFGFLHKQKIYPQEQEVLVYPRVEELSYLPHGNEQQLGSYRSLPKWLEDMSAVSGLRDYLPGDRLSRIDWKASARTGSLKTKEFEQRHSRQFMFFLDREERAYSKGTVWRGEETRSTSSPVLQQALSTDLLFELGVSLTASLVHSVLKQGFPCGLMSYGSHGLELIPMAQWPEQLNLILSHLARVEADSQLLFREQVWQQAVALPHGATLVLITPQVEQKLVMFLSELSHRQQKVEFFWLKGTALRTQTEQELLSVMEGEGIVYHVIEEENFSGTLSKGGGLTYASQKKHAF